MFERISNLSSPPETGLIVLHQRWTSRVFRDLIPVARSITVSPANAQRIIAEAQVAPAVRVSALAHGARLIESAFMTDEQIVVETRKGKVHILKINELLAADFRAARWEW